MFLNKWLPTCRFTLQQRMWHHVWGRRFSAAATPGKVCSVCLLLCSFSLPTARIFSHDLFLSSIQAKGCCASPHSNLIRSVSQAFFTTTAPLLFFLFYPHSSSLALTFSDPHLTHTFFSPSFLFNLVFLQLHSHSLPKKKLFKQWDST